MPSCNPADLNDLRAAVVSGGVLHLERTAARLKHLAP